MFFDKETTIDGSHGRWSARVILTTDRTLWEFDLMANAESTGAVHKGNGNKTKTCNRCSLERPVEEFVRNWRMPSGRINQCNRCRLMASRAYKSLSKVKEKRRKRDEAVRDQMKKVKMNWKNKNRHKIQAHDKVYRAVRAGKILKPERCEKCSHLGKVQAHHESYSEPYDVVWLCPDCHYGRHRELNDEAYDCRQSPEE
jgi:hypothetical protein